VCERNSKRKEKSESKTALNVFSKENYMLARLGWLSRDGRCSTLDIKHKRKQHQHHWQIAGKKSEK